MKSLVNVAAVLTAVLLGVGPAAARIDLTGAGPRESRAEELRAMRQERSREVEPKRYSKLLSFMAALENKGFDQMFTVQVEDILVGFGKISPLSGFAPGVGYMRPHLGGKDLRLSLSGAYSVSGYQAYVLRIGDFDLVAPHELLGSGFLGAPFSFDKRDVHPPKRFLYGEVAYRNFPRERFYGIGPDASAGDRAEYRLELGGPSVAAGYQIRRWLALSATVGYVAANVGPSPGTRHPDVSERFDERTAPGSEIQTSYIKADSALYAGYGGDPNYPFFLTGLRFARWEDREDLGYSFNRFSFDARAYLPLGSRTRTVAARFYHSRDDAAGGNTVPFYFMQTMGGETMLRGYRKERFRDTNLLFLGAEYRWEANASTELALFYDWGKVYGDDQSLGFDDMKDSYGIGVRFKNRRRVILRFDVARSDEKKTLLQFSLGPSF